MIRHDHAPGRMDARGGAVLLEGAAAEEDA
jgi:hypothetical protein